ncbi:MAG: substrate-binding domain-containing protein [Candidatus Devosia euplotis]|nr:substrate-binding domain-containing protein [Candidatus Devosia euplotis]
MFVSNVNPGISTTDQREEGFKLEMSENFPKIEVLETQLNKNDANNAASQLQAVFARNADLKDVFGVNLFSALGAANGVQQADQSGTIKVVASILP